MKTRRAFTLVEMVVATLLLAIGVVGALSAFSSATRSIGIARDVDAATLLARRNLTELQLRSQPLVAGDDSGDFGDQYPGFRWRRHVEATEHRGLSKVELTVEWGQATPRSRRFVTYVRDGAATPPQPTPTPPPANSNGSGSSNAQP